MVPGDNQFNDLPHWYFSSVIDFRSVIMSVFRSVRRGWGGQPVWTAEQQKGGWTGAMTPPLSLSKTVISISVDSPGLWQTLPSLPTLFSWTSTGLCHEVPHKRLFSEAFTVFSGAFTATIVIVHTYMHVCVCLCVLPTCLFIETSTNCFL